MKRKPFFGTLILAGTLFFLSHPGEIRADDVQNVSYLERGTMRILTAAFQLPRYLIQKTMTGPPIVGTVDGAISGTFYTVASLVGGAFDLVKGAIPYAKYMVFFI